VLFNAAFQLIRFDIHVCPALASTFHFLLSISYLPLQPATFLPFLHVASDLLMQMCRCEGDLPFAPLVLDRNVYDFYSRRSDVMACRWSMNGLNNCHRNKLLNQQQLLTGRPKGINHCL